MYNKKEVLTSSMPTSFEQITFIGKREIGFGWFSVSIFIWIYVRRVLLRQIFNPKSHIRTYHLYVGYIISPPISKIFGGNVFNERLECTYECWLHHNIIIVFNANMRKEGTFGTKIFRLHPKTSSDALWLIDFTGVWNIVVFSSRFQRKKIH